MSSWMRPWSRKRTSREPGRRKASVGSTPGTDHGAALSGATASNDLMNKVVQGAHQTIDKLAEKAGPTVQRLADSVQGANESLHQRADHVREMGDEWVESLRGTVREHPLAAVATALAVGVLIARLTQR